MKEVIDANRKTTTQSKYIQVGAVPEVAGHVEEGVGSGWDYLTTCWGRSYLSVGRDHVVAQRGDMRSAILRGDVRTPRLFVCFLQEVLGYCCGVGW